MNKQIRVVAADQCGWLVQDSTVVPYVFENPAICLNFKRTNIIHSVVVSPFTYARKQALALLFDIPTGRGVNSLQLIFDCSIHKNFIRGLSYATTCFLLFTEETAKTPTLNTFHRHGTGFTIHSPKPLHNEFTPSRQVPN